jgi:prophage regulatory protein
MQTEAANSKSKLIPFNDVRDRLGGISRTTIWRLCSQGSFPKPIHATAGRSLWLESEIEQWIADRAASRREGAAYHAA